MGFCLSARLLLRKRRSAHRSVSAILTVATVATFGMALMAFPKPASARIMVGGGYFCDATIYDVGGVVQGVWYDNCIYDPPFGGGGSPGPDPTGYHPLPDGGGGGGNPNPNPCSDPAPVSRTP